MLHHKLLYGQCHKQHHEYKAPVGIVAAYCHPFEMLVSNVIPLFAGALIANSHLYTVYAWILFAVLGTQSHHCGYHWPWMFHDHQPSFHGAQPVNNLHRSYNQDTTHVPSPPHYSWRTAGLLGAFRSC